MINKVDDEPTTGAKYEQIIYFDDFVMIMAGRENVPLDAVTEEQLRRYREHFDSFAQGKCYICASDVPKIDEDEVNTTLINSHKVFHQMCFLFHRSHLLCIYINQSELRQISGQNHPCLRVAGHDCRRIEC